MAHLPRQTSKTAAFQKFQAWDAQDTGQPPGLVTRFAKSFLQSRGVSPTSISMAEETDKSHFFDLLRASTDASDLLFTLPPPSLTFAGFDVPRPVGSNRSSEGGL